MQGKICIFPGVFDHFFKLHLTHAELGFAFADEVFDGHHLVIEVRFGKVIQFMAQIRLAQVVGYHGVEIGSFDIHTIPLHEGGIVFGILANPQFIIRFQQVFEFMDQGFGFGLILRHGHVVRFVGFNGKYQANSFCHMGIYAGGFCIEADGFFLLQHGN